MLSKEFGLFLQEGHLARSCLLSGFGFLNAADYMERKGGYYSAFFQLSIGIERLIKIAYMLNYKLENNMSLPPEKEIFKLGHDLVRGYNICADFKDAPDSFCKAGSVEYDMLTILSDFGRTSRYHNVNELLRKQTQADPIRAWHKIHVLVANEDISLRRQETLNMKAIAHCDRMRMFNYAQNVNGDYIPYVDILSNMLVLEAASPSCVWRVISMVSPFYKLLYQLCSELHKKDDDSVPYMYEFFAFLLCDKASALRRRSWASFLR